MAIRTVGPTSTVNLSITRRQTWASQCPLINNSQARLRDLTLKSYLNTVLVMSMAGLSSSLDRPSSHTSDSTSSTQIRQYTTGPYQTPPIQTWSHKVTTRSCPTLTWGLLKLSIPLRICRIVTMSTHITALPTAYRLTTGPRSR
jgi:hypothetical protein